MIPLFDNSVYEWGMHVIHAIQSVKNVFFTYFMIFISFLSDPLAYLSLLPIFFWCVDEKKTAKVSLLVLFSASINTSIKDFLCVPRPFIQDPAVGLIPETGFSTPSGHSQNSAAFWPYAVFLFSKKEKVSSRFIVKLFLSVGLPLLIGFSRIYLGVHYPSDVLLGWTLGFIISLGTILFVPFLESYVIKLPRSLKILIIGITAFILNWIGPHDTSMAAAFFGLGIGYIYICDTGGYDAKAGTRIQKLFRAILGLIVVALIYTGLSFVFPLEGEANYNLFRFIRYMLVGFTASFILPKTFIAMKIGFSRASNG